MAPGTDLHLSVEGRTWLNDEGRKNFPGGEIFTAPIEDSVNGTVEFSFPAYYGGREVVQGDGVEPVGGEPLHLGGKVGRSDR